MISLEYFSVRRPLMHVSQVVLHTLRGKHVDVFDPKRLENVLLEVVIERRARHSLDDCASPIDPNPILPLCARLKD